MVIKHFETAIQALRIRITHQFINQIISFVNKIQADDSSKDEEAAARQLFMSSQSPPPLSRRSPVTLSTLSNVLRSPKAATKRFFDATSFIKGGVGSKDSLNSGRVSIASATDLHQKELNEMKERSAQYITFNYVRLGEILLYVSYTGGNKSIHGIEDFSIMELKLHKRLYHGVTAPMTSFLKSILADVLLDVFSQAGRNFTNLGTAIGQTLGLSRLAALSSEAKEAVSAASTSISERSTPENSTAEDSGSNKPPLFANHNKQPTRKPIKFSAFSRKGARNTNVKADNAVDNVAMLLGTASPAKVEAASKSSIGSIDDTCEEKTDAYG